MTDGVLPAVVGVSLSDLLPAFTSEGDSINHSSSTGCRPSSLSVTVGVSVSDLLPVSNFRSDTLNDEVSLLLSSWIQTTQFVC